MRRRQSSLGGPRTARGGAGPGWARLVSAPVTLERPRKRGGPRHGRAGDVVRRSGCRLGSWPDHARTRLRAGGTGRGTRLNHGRRGGRESRPGSRPGPRLTAPSARPALSPWVARRAILPGSPPAAVAAGAGHHSRHARPPQGGRALVLSRPSNGGRGPSGPPWLRARGRGAASIRGGCRVRRSSLDATPLPFNHGKYLKYMAHRCRPGGKTPGHGQGTTPHAAPWPAPLAAARSAYRRRHAVADAGGYPHGGHACAIA